MEKPYLRKFERDPISDVLSDRGRYIAAVLTVARAYVAAGKPKPPTPLVSFGSWSDLVRGSLMWLRRADPVDTIEQVAKLDPSRENRLTIFNAMHIHSPSAPMEYSVPDLIKMSTANDQLKTALIAVAGGKGDDAGNIGPEKLNWWLKRNKDRVVGDDENKYKLQRVEEKRRNQMWMVKVTPKPKPPQPDY
jgi:hypothetical protein